MVRAFPEAWKYQGHKVNIEQNGLTRRGLLGMIGSVAGAAVMYSAMTEMGLAQPSPYTGRLKLEGDAKGASVLILGAGLAGMTAAYELRAAGYKVQILEYREKAGGRCWSIRGGDVVTEFGSADQHCTFDDGNYINPGPWRIPSDHYAVLDYCKRFGVELEPFIQINFNAYLHRKDAFEGKPQRFKEIESDYRGGISELLAKAVNQHKLDELVTEADAEKLLASLKRYGMLDNDYNYVEGKASSDYRGYAKPAGGGVDGKPVPSPVNKLVDILNSGMWNQITTGFSIDHQSTIFQPKGGMDLIAKAFERETKEMITYNAKVVRIRNSAEGVEAAYVDAVNGGAETIVKADFCICTIPFSVLGQIDHDFSGEMTDIIDSMYYASSFKAGLEFKRRFWEEDEHIYGGITYTDLPISQISYPSNDYFKTGSGVLLGGYCWGASAYQFNALSPEQRIEKTLEYGSKIHPQYRDEFKSGVAVAWHRQSWILGCYGIWKDKDAQYQNACKMDGRTLMAGEHISYLGAWQEGAILSALDATERLHAHVVKG